MYAQGDYYLAYAKFPRQCSRPTFNQVHHCDLAAKALHKDPDTCMYVCYVCMYAMYVCIDSGLTWPPRRCTRTPIPVCMYAMYVCMYVLTVA